MVVSVERIDGKELVGGHGRESSREVQTRIIRARAFSTARNPMQVANSRLSGRDIKLLLPANSEASQLLENAIDRLDLSPRAAWRSVRVARTIADLDNAETIDARHLSEALQYRLREQVLV